MMVHGLLQNNPCLAFATKTQKDPVYICTLCQITKIYLPKLFPPVLQFKQIGVVILTGLPFFKHTLIGKQDISLFERDNGYDSPSCKTGKTLTHLGFDLSLLQISFNVTHHKIHSSYGMGLLPYLFLKAVLVVKDIG
jgi:hypothetical protein